MVANMFFATTMRQSGIVNLPRYYDFTRLTPQHTEIMKCTLNYFERSQKAKNLDHQSIVFFRIAQTPSFESWFLCNDKLC